MLKSYPVVCMLFGMTELQHVNEGRSENLVTTFVLRVNTFFMMLLNLNQSDCVELLLLIPFIYVILIKQFVGAPK